VVCFIPGGAFILAAYAVFAGICWPLAVRVFDVIWTVGTIAARSLAATLVLIVATLLVAFAAWFTRWTGHLVRSYRQARGQAPLCTITIPGTGKPVPCPVQCEIRPTVDEILSERAS